MAKPSKSITPQITYGFLGLLGVVTLMLGFSSLGRVINSPGQRAVLERQKVDDRVQSANVAAEQQLRVQDTDLDGLTDFNELNLYGTSPYLADSDSDGFNDKQEIESNNDPNCPVGITCRSVPVGQENPLIDERGVVVDNFADLLVNEPGQGAPAIDVTNLNIDQVRDLILQSGDVSAAQLSEIDDETIMQIYRQVISQENIGTISSGGTPASPSTEPAIDINNLSATEIRELILRSGEMTTEQLSQIDDATIMQIYQQMINEAGGSL